MPRVIVNTERGEQEEYKFVFERTRKYTYAYGSVGPVGSRDEDKAPTLAGYTRLDSRDRPNAVIGRREALRQAISNLPKEIRAQIWNQIPLRKPKK